MSLSLPGTNDWFWDNYLEMMLQLMEIIYGEFDEEKVLQRLYDYGEDVETAVRFVVIQKR